MSQITANSVWDVRTAAGGRDKSTQLSGFWARLGLLQVQHQWKKMKIIDCIPEFYLMLTQVVSFGIIFHGTLVLRPLLHQFQSRLLGLFQ